MVGTRFWGRRCRFLALLEPCFVRCAFPKVPRAVLRDLLLRFRCVTVAIPGGLVGRATSGGDRLWAGRGGGDEPRRASRIGPPGHLSDAAIAGLLRHRRANWAPNSRLHDRQRVPAQQADLSTTAAGMTLRTCARTPAGCKRGFDGLWLSLRWRIVAGISTDPFPTEAA